MGSHDVFVIPDDDVACKLRIHPIERMTIVASIAAASDAEIIAYRRGAFAFCRGEPGALEDADRVYPTDMICRVAWRTGWMTHKRFAKEPAR